MTSDIQLNLITHNCEANDLIRHIIKKHLEIELVRFSNHAEIDLTLSKVDDLNWSCDLSMRYPRGHIATMNTNTSLAKAVDNSLIEFTKELRIHEFQSAIETFHFDNAGEYDYFTEVSSETIAMPKRKLTTLVVEDDPATSIVLQATLKALGCAVDHFDLPSKALQAISTKRFDFLVLDWNLPYMKGGQFLVEADRILKARDIPGQPTRHIPVVICTSMPLSDIILPPVTHFFFYNHWHKSLPFSSVLGSVDEVTKNITIRNQIVFQKSTEVL